MSVTYVSQEADTENVQKLQKIISEFFEYFEQFPKELEGVVFAYFDCRKNGCEVHYYKYGTIDQKILLKLGEIVTKYNFTTEILYTPSSTHLQFDEIKYVTHIFIRDKITIKRDE